MGYLASYCHSDIEQLCAHHFYRIWRQKLVHWAGLRLHKLGALRGWVFDGPFPHILGAMGAFFRDRAYPLWHGKSARGSHGPVEDLILEIEAA